MSYRTSCLVIAMLLAFVKVEAQETGSKQGHVDWHFSSVKQSGSAWKLLFTAVIDRGWHIYAQATPEGGPMPVSFRFTKEDGYRLSGEIKESGVLRKGYDNVFMTDVFWYEGTVIFSQVVKATSKGVVRGEIEYVVCSEEMCIPGSIQFSLDVGN